MIALFSRFRQVLILPCAFIIAFGCTSCTPNSNKESVSIKSTPIKVKTKSEIQIIYNCFGEEYSDQENDLGIIMYTIMIASSADSCYFISIKKDKSEHIIVVKRIEPGIFNVSKFDSIERAKRCNYIVSEFRITPLCYSKLACQMDSLLSLPKEDSGLNRGIEDGRILNLRYYAEGNSPVFARIVIPSEKPQINQLILEVLNTCKIDLSN